MDLKLGDDGDLAFTSAGDIATVQGGEEVRQRIDLVLSTLRGDYAFDLDFGVSYLEDVFVKPANVSTIDALLRSAIEAVEGVKRVVAYEGAIDDATRQYGSSFTVELVSGVTVEGEATIGGVGASSSPWVALE